MDELNALWRQLCAESLRSLDHVGDYYTRRINPVTMLQHRFRFTGRSGRTQMNCVSIANYTYSGMQDQAVVKTWLEKWQASLPESGRDIVKRTPQPGSADLVCEIPVDVPAVVVFAHVARTAHVEFGTEDAPTTFDGVYLILTALERYSGPFNAPIDQHKKDETTSALRDQLCTWREKVAAIGTTNFAAAADVRASDAAASGAQSRLTAARIVAVVERLKARGDALSVEKLRILETVAMKMK